MQERVTTFGFRLLAQDGAARRGEVTTPRGTIRTPAFMPVGTAATVKALYFDQVKDAGADIVLANTYHLMLRPGAERVARLGGLHTFMRWDGPILTDSGGFQVMSLSKIREMSEEGVRFQSHIDGSRHMLTPERAVDIQCLLGSDIQMQLDECIELPAERQEAERAMELSLRWAERARAPLPTRAAPGQALFGIVQGGIDAGLRRRSAEALVGMDFPGYARRRSCRRRGAGTHAAHARGRAADPAGGKAALPDGRRHAVRSHLVGGARRRHVRLRAADAQRPPRPRLHMGRQGQPAQRQARRGCSAARPRERCPAARDYSRAYLHHLVKSGEFLGAMLLSWVNTAFYQELMGAMRARSKRAASPPGPRTTLARIDGEP